jgi:hypothetical protein
VVIASDGDVYVRHGHDGRWSMTAARGAVIEASEPAVRGALANGGHIAHVGTE